MKTHAQDIYWKNAGLLLALVTALGALLRFWHLGLWDFWSDEAHSALIAANPSYYSSCISINPCFFERLLHVWMRAFGTGEAALRALPALASTLCIPAVFALAALVFDRKSALWAAFLLALSPLSVYYGQELRAYSLLTLLALLYACAFVLVLRGGGLWPRLAFVFCGAAGVHTHVMFLLFAFSLWAFAVFAGQERGHVRTVTLLSVAVVLAFVPWLVLHAGTVLNLGGNSWIPRPGWARGKAFVEALCIGFCADRVFAATALCLFAVLIGLACAGRARIRTFGCRLCLFMALVPAVIAFVLSQFASVFLVRNLVFVLPFLLILAGRGLALLPLSLRIVSAVLAAFLAGGSLSAYYAADYARAHLRWPGIFVKAPVKPVAECMRSLHSGRDIIAHGSDALFLPLVWYLNRDLIAEDMHRTGRFTACEDRNAPLERHHMLALSWMMDKSWHFYVTGCMGPTDGEGNGNFIDLAGSALTEELSDRRILFVAGSWQRDGTLNENSRLALEVLGHDRRELARKESGGVVVTLFDVLDGSGA